MNAIWLLSDARKKIINFYRFGDSFVGVLAISLFWETHDGLLKDKMSQWFIKNINR